MSRTNRKKDKDVELIDETVFNKVKGLNDEQDEFIRLIHRNYITVCTGKAGTGKTNVACGVAAQYLLSQRIKQIILTRPMVAAEESGFLPGTLEQKIDPYIRPMIVELGKYCNVKSLMQQGKIVVHPLAYMRGSNINDSIVLADECQNTDMRLLKLLLTRLSDNSKIVIMGDIKQSDLKYKQCDFSKVIDNVLKPLSEEEENSIGIIDLKISVRHWLVEKIADKFEEWES